MRNIEKFGTFADCKKGKYHKNKNKVKKVDLHNHDNVLKWFENLRFTPWHIVLELGNSSILDIHNCTRIVSCCVSVKNMPSMEPYQKCTWTLFDESTTTTNKLIVDSWLTGTTLWCNSKKNKNKVILLLVQLFRSKLACWIEKIFLNWSL